MGQRHRNHFAQGRAVLAQQIREIRGQHQVAGRIVAQRLRHVVEHRRADDAPGPPDPGDGGLVQRPAKAAAGAVQQGKALRVTQDLAGDQRGVQIAERQRPVGQALRGGTEAVLTGPALRQQRREVARGHGGFDHRNRRAQMLRLDRRPAPGALLPRPVQDHVQDGRARGRIQSGADFARDFRQVGLQRAGVPACEHRPDGGGLQAQPVTHHAVAFGDQLHVGIFDSVVRGLDEMASAGLAHPGGAGRTSILRRDGGEDRRDAVPGRARPAAHDRRTVPRAFGPARHADPHEPGTQRAGPALGVTEIGVARVDDQIAAVQQRAQGLDLLIDDFTGGHHQDNLARARQRGDQIGQAVGRGQARCQIPRLRHEFARALPRAVVDRDAKTLLGNVQGQHRPHCAQTDQADIALRHDDLRSGPDWGRVPGKMIRFARPDQPLIPGAGGCPPDRRAAAPAPRRACCRPGRPPTHAAPAPPDRRADRRWPATGPHHSRKRPN